MIAETPNPSSRSCLMARLLRFAVAVSLVLWSGTAVLALPVAGTEASSPQPPATNTTAQQQLSIAYTSEGRGTVGELVENEFRNSEILVIKITDGSLILGPQSDTRIQVQDVTTGQTLTLTPTNNSKSVTLGTNERLGVAPEVAEDEPASISEFSLSGIEINTTVSGDTKIFKTQKFSRFVVSVLAPDGSVVAQTEPALHGVFRPELTGEFNDTAVAIERPDDFNASWYVRGESVGVSGFQLTNVEGADFFRAQEIPGEFSSLEESFTLEVYPSDPGLGGSGERISAPILDLTRVEGPVEARGAPGGGSGSPGPVKPNVTAVSQPSGSVSANSSFEIDYRITNPDEAPTAFTFTVPTTSPNLSVTGFAGEIQGPNPDGTPPSTSTTAVDPGQTASVTVTYRVAANATGTGNVTVEASSAFLNGTGVATTTVELGEPAVPTTPRGRALQVAGVEDPAAISQRDITVAITLRDRGQPTNGVDVSQRDITTLITLRDRAN